MSRCGKPEPAIAFAALRPPDTAAQILWREPPGTAALDDSEIHLWRVRLDRFTPQPAQFAGLLASDELERAHRFRFERDRARFVVGRGLLRLILSRYSGIPAARLIFFQGPRGKPRLLSATGDDLLHFNVTHSDGLALYAVARAGEVGIDIERVRPVAESEQIAARFFSERECHQWRSLPARLQTEAFFNCWTRKEACLKANGEGITESLKQIEGSLLPREPARWRGRARDGRATLDCLLQALTPAVGYVGALAVRRRIR